VGLNPFKKLFDYNAKEISRIRKTVVKINDLSDGITALDDTDLAAKTIEFRERLESGQTLDDILPEAFAVAREAAD